MRHGALMRRYETWSQAAVCTAFDRAEAGSPSIGQQCNQLAVGCILICGALGAGQTVLWHMLATYPLRATTLAMYNGRSISNDSGGLCTTTSQEYCVPPARRAHDACPGDSGAHAPPNRRCSKPTPESRTPGLSPRRWGCLCASGAAEQLADDGRLVPVDGLALGARLIRHDRKRRPQANTTCRSMAVLRSALVRSDLGSGGEPLWERLPLCELRLDDMASAPAGVWASGLCGEPWCHENPQRPSPTAS